MPYLLEDLVVDRVDLVDEGANSAAFISLYKRKERIETMDYKEIIAKMAPEQGKLIQAKFDELTGEVTKANEDLAKATADLDTANEDLANTKSELDTLKAGSNSAAFDEEETMKALPKEAREILTKMKAQKDAAEQELRKAKEAEQHSEAVAKAATLKSLPVEETKLIDLCKNATPEMLEILTTVAKAMDETLLGEVGKSKAGSTSTGNDAWAQIEAKAEEVAKKTNISKAKAITQVVNENPDLYKQYLQGGAN